MYGVMLVVILILTGGAIAFIGDRLGSKVGKKKLSLFGMRPKHTSILVTIITGILITTVSIGIMAVASKDVRTALFGMEKLKTEMNNTRRYLDETSTALEGVKKDLNSTKEEYANSKKELEVSKVELAQAKEVVNSMRQEQVLLQNKNQELWLANNNLTGDNERLIADNNDLLVSNNSLKDSNANLEKLNHDLQIGIENMREKPIIYRVGELLASGIIKKTDDPTRIQADLGEIVSLANSKIVDRLGSENARDGVWIYPTEYQKAVDKLKNASGDTVVRLIVAANLVKGDPVLTNLEIHPNRIVYQKDELIYEKGYNLNDANLNTEQLIADFLQNVNMEAVNQGILPNPLTGAVGVINGNQLYGIEKALQSAKGNISVSAYAIKDTDILGPLRLDIILKQEDE